MSITKEESDAIYAGPAVLANKVYLILYPSHGRLSFVEQSQDGECFGRAAVTMSVADLKELQKLLATMLDEQTNIA